MGIDKDVCVHGVILSFHCVVVAIVAVVAVVTDAFRVKEINLKV